VAELAKIAFSDTRMALDWDGGFAGLDDLAVRWIVYKLTTEAARGRDRKTGKTGPPWKGFSQRINASFRAASNTGECRMGVASRQGQEDDRRANAYFGR
jgi:hypothetical protein